MLIEFCWTDVDHCMMSHAKFLLLEFMRKFSVSFENSAAQLARNISINERTLNQVHCSLLIGSGDNWNELNWPVSLLSDFNSINGNEMEWQFRLGFVIKYIDEIKICTLIS